MAMTRACGLTNQAHPQSGAAVVERNQKEQMKNKTLNVEGTPAVAVKRVVSLGHVAACAMIINAMAIIMAVLGIVGSETLAAALYWPWVTFVIVAMTPITTRIIIVFVRPVGVTASMLDHFGNKYEFSIGHF